MRYNWFSIFLFLFLPMALSGQTAELDSLKAEIESMENDTHKVNKLLDLSQKLLSYNLESGSNYANKAKELSIILNYSMGEANAYYRIGHAQLELGNTDTALNHLDKALKIFNSLKDAKGRIKCYNLMGIYHLRNKNKNDALKYLYEAASLSEKHNIKEYAAISYNNVGEVFNYANDSINALKYYKKAVELMGEGNESYSAVMQLMNIANLEKDLSKAIEYLNKAIQISKKKSYNNSLAYCYASLGDIYHFKIKNYEKAKSSYLKGLHYSKISGDYRMKSHSLMFLSGVFLELNQVDSAAHYFNQLNLENLEENHTKNYLYYKSKLLHKQKKYPEAFTFMDSSLSKHIEDYNANLAQQIADANARFENDKKALEIERQQALIEKKESQKRALLLAGAFLTLLLISIAFYIHQRAKRKKRESEMALQLEKEKGEHLETMSRMKTQLFNNISHEIRTPLTLIIAPLESALSKVKNKDTQIQIEQALRNSKKILTMTNEILDLSKLDSGKESLITSEINIKKYLSRRISAFHSLASSQNIDLQYSLKNIPENYMLLTDPNKLEKIINNLVSNAIKYSPSGSTIFVSAKIKSDNNHNFLDFAVKDNGEGIADSDIDKIFERFHQLEQTNHIGGTGIGLALVKELINLLGGSIHVQSKIGEGSTFSFSIPVEQVSQDEISSDTLLSFYQSSIKTNKVSEKDERLQILVVEDDIEMSEYLRSLLSEIADCHSAFNGHQAFEKLSTHQFDLITSDIMMPEMDGFQFREKLNAIPGYKDIPFVMISARNLEDDILKGFKMGIDDYITKPFSPLELIARINKLVSNKKQRNEIQLESSELNSFDEAFLEKAKDSVKRELDNSDFGVEELANTLNYSTRQLSRILQKLTGMSSVEFILEIRLSHAYSLLSQGTYKTVKEVQYEIGIESPSYLNKKFKERYGISPGQLLKK